MTYNPHHAGWFHFIVENHFMYLRRFEDALTEAKRINMPHFQWTLSISRRRPGSSAGAKRRRYSCMRLRRSTRRC